MSDVKRSMSSPGFRFDVVDVLDQVLTGIPGVGKAKSFGLPGYTVGKKVFATAYGDGAALKLPRERIAELLAQPGFAPFQPFGQRTMKEWVMLSLPDAAAYTEHFGLFEEALAFVAAQGGSSAGC